MSSLVTIHKTCSAPQGSRQEFTQLTTGTEYSALDRPHWNTEPDGHLFIAQAVQINEGKGRPEHGIDLLQGSTKNELDLFCIWTIVGSLGRLNRQQVSLSIARTHGVLGPFACSVDASIGGNAIQVRGQPRLSPELGQASIQLQERILCNVIGQITIEGNANGHREDESLVVAHDGLVQLGPPRHDLIDSLCELRHVIHAAIIRIWVTLHRSRCQPAPV